MSVKSFTQELSDLGIRKSELARELGLSPEQISRWREEPPAYVIAFLKQVKKNREIQAKLDYFMSLSHNDEPKEWPEERKIYSITELLQENETALAVFTRGAYLEIRENNTGFSGNWVIDPDKEVDRLIIYKRNETIEPFVNDIYIADYIWPEGPISKDKRYRIHFKNIEHVGTTPYKWKEFSGGGANPIKYIGFSENKEKSNDINLNGDEQFIHDLPTELLEIGKKLLYEIRQFNKHGILKFHEKSKKYVESPDNFWTVRIQKKDKSLRITVKGAPESFKALPKDILKHIKPDMGTYSAFKMSTREEDLDIDSAIQVIKFAGI
ncbi:MAG: hypothetical protein GWN14_25100 [candidate division Zixibacteria bacterium]|nr:hypothetical protein [Candidatus Dadabacteria bacterium]NIW44006.1 hypothetical protein [Gammaproteobacteria bacterium]NIX59106.1 hypothetical protein [candidate division Zixibacteria bacterium]